MRLDSYLVENNLAESRNKAQQLIINSAVCVNNNIITKNGFLVNENDVIEIVKSVCPYVSRAGLKLEGAIKSFDINLQGKVILDIGSSTGGFSDCALKHGAKKVYALDVGTNQLHPSLIKNEKVVKLENTDIRVLEKNIVEDLNFIICDVSFISLTKISHKISEFLQTGAYAIVLIKPQFECGNTLAKKFKGVIKDEKIHKMIISDIKEDFLSKRLEISKIEKSCIQGSDGNIEYVALLRKL